jgi:hypothetical protein
MSTDLQILKVKLMRLEMLMERMIEMEKQKYLDWYLVRQIPMARLTQKEMYLD